MKDDLDSIIQTVAIVAAILIFCCGCSNKEAHARTGADLWHMGAALETGRMDLKGQVIMGQTLKTIGDKMAEENGYEVAK